MRGRVWKKLDLSEKARRFAWLGGALLPYLAKARLMLRTGPRLCEVKALGLMACLTPAPVGGVLAGAMGALANTATSPPPAERERRPVPRSIAATAWKPGQSGNPAGRPVGLGKAIRKALGDGSELVEILLSIARGEQTAKSTASGVQIEAEPPTRLERLAAIKLLLEHGWGKPATKVEVSGPDGGAIPVGRFDLGAMGAQDLDSLEKGLEAAALAERETIEGEVVE